MKSNSPIPHSTVTRSGLHSKGRSRTVFKDASETTIAKQVKEAFARMKRRPPPRAFYETRDPEVIAYERWMSGDN